MAITTLNTEKATIVYIPPGVVLGINAYILPEGVGLVLPGTRPQTRIRDTSREAGQGHQT